MILLLALLIFFFDVNSSEGLSSSPTLFDSSSSLSRNSHVSAVIPSPFLTNQRALPAIKVNLDGKIESVQLLKQNLAHDLELPLRDFRIVDPSYPTQIQANFIARPDVILLTLENIKVIVKHNETYVFNPNQSEVQEFIPALQQQIAHLEISAGAGHRARFEHVVLEVALNVVCSNLLRKVRNISPAVLSALRGLRQQSRGLEVVQTQVDELLPLKNKIDELDKRIKEVKRAILQLYDNDEDMELMYLGKANLPTKHVASIGDSSDPIKGKGKDKDINDMKDKQLDSLEMNLELLLENYLTEVAWISSEVEELMDEITNTEENLVLQLDIIRNRMLRFELMLSISSFVVGCGALITGAFGMNLLSHLEMNKHMFWTVSIGIVGGMISMGLLGVRYARKQKLF